MNQKWTYKQLNRFLLVASILFALLIWFMAIKKTARVYDNNIEMQERLKSLENAPQDIRKYEKSLAQLKSRLGPWMANDTLQGHVIMEKIGELCTTLGLTLREFPEIIQEEEADYTIATHVVKAAGPYTKLVKLVYAMEYEQKLGRVSSLQFRLKRDRRTKKRYLEATIYLQNLKSNDKSNM